MANCMDWRVARARAARHAPAPTRARAHHHARHERRWGSRCRKNSVLREPVRAWDICEFTCSYGVPAVVFLVQSVSAESCSVSGDFVNFFSWIFPGRAERRGHAKTVPVERIYNEWRKMKKRYAEPKNADLYAQKEWEALMQKLRDMQFAVAP